MFFREKYISLITFIAMMMMIIFPLSCKKYSYLFRDLGNPITNSTDSKKSKLSVVVITYKKTSALSLFGTGGATDIQTQINSAKEIPLLTNVEQPKIALPPLLKEAAANYGVILARFDAQGVLTDVDEKVKLNACYHIAKDSLNQVFMLDPDYSLKTFISFTKVKQKISFQGVLCISQGKPAIFIGEERSQGEQNHGSIFITDYLSLAKLSLVGKIRPEFSSREIKVAPTKISHALFEFDRNLQEQSLKNTVSDSSLDRSSDTTQEVSLSPENSSSDGLMESPSPIVVTSYSPDEPLLDLNTRRLSADVQAVEQSITRDILDRTSCFGPCAILEQQDFKDPKSLLFVRQKDLISTAQNAIDKIIPPLSLKLATLDDVVSALRRFPEQKLNLEQKYLPPTAANAIDRGGNSIKEVVEANAGPKNTLIDLLVESPDFHGREDQVIRELMLAHVGSGSKVREKIETAIDFLYERSSQKTKDLIIAEFKKNLTNPQIKTRYYSAHLLKKYKLEEAPQPEELDKLLNHFDAQETKDWETSFSDPANFSHDDFMFMIHGVINDPVRPRGELFGLFKGKNAFQDPEVFLERGRVATSIIGSRTGTDGTFTSETRTFAPTGFVLETPRTNITHASEHNFASTGKYVSRKAKLKSPFEILSTTSGKYNEILVEGTNRVSKRKTTIVGVFIKEGTPEVWAKEARDFAKARGLPIAIIPGKWDYHFKIPPESWDSGSSLTH